MTDIFALARGNKAEEVRSMLNKGIGARAADEQGRTLLHHAAASNAVLVIDLLLERGASFDFKDAKGYTPLCYAAKQKSEDGVISLIERGSDPNPKFPDGTWMRDNFPDASFAARIAAARQVYATKTASTSNNLLMSILNTSSAPAAGATAMPNSPGSPVVKSPSAGSFSSSSPTSPTSPHSDVLISPSSRSSAASSSSSTKNTMRRSTISMKATADKDIVLEGASGTYKDPTFRASGIYSSPPLPPPSASSAASAVATLRLSAANTPHSRRGSVTYATIRPRSTLSSAEGVALRNEVSQQMASSGGGSLAPLHRLSPSSPSSSTTSTTTSSSSSSAATPDGSAPDAAKSHTNGPQSNADTSAGSAISDALSSDSSKKKKGKKEKKQKNDNKEKKEKKEKKKGKKSGKTENDAADSPEHSPDASSPPPSDSPSSTKSKKQQKAELKKRQEEEEKAKEEARAEKTKKRKTISIFSSKSSKKSEKEEKSAKVSESGNSAAEKAQGRTKEGQRKSITFDVPPINAAVQTSMSSNSNGLVQGSTTMTTTNQPPSSSSPSSATNQNGTQATTTTTTTTISPPMSPHGFGSARSARTDGTGTTVMEETALVDNVPDGAVPLANGDFLVSIESDAVNLDALTDAMARVMREAVSPLLGTPNFEIKSLLEATKALSSTLKSILSVSEVYSLTLETEEAGREFKEITDGLRSETARSLVEAIKAVTVDSSNIKPLKLAMVELSERVESLYKVLEAVSGASVVEILQLVVVNLRAVVSASKTSQTKEEMQNACSQAVLMTMRLTSLVQDFAFAKTISVRNRRSLYDSAFALAQSVRGLVVAATGVFADPRSEQHASGMAQMLKTAAEFVRAISRTLRDEDSILSNPKFASELDHLLEPAPHDIVVAYLRKGCGLMANAKDKYLAKASSASIDIAYDEKQILSVIVSQAQLIASLIDALPSDFPSLLQSAVSAGQSMSLLQKLIQPILDTCLDSYIVDETVSCLENAIRCSIQVKILASLIASHSSSSEYRLQLAQMCQLWGVYSCLLLEAVWRAVHVL